MDHGDAQRRGASWCPRLDPPTFDQDGPTVVSVAAAEQVHQCALAGSDFARRSMDLLALHFHVDPMEHRCLAKCLINLPQLETGSLVRFLSRNRGTALGGMLHGLHGSFTYGAGFLTLYNIHGCFPSVPFGVISLLELTRCLEGPLCWVLRNVGLSHAGQGDEHIRLLHETFCPVSH